MPAAVLAGGIAIARCSNQSMTPSGRATKPSSDMDMQSTSRPAAGALIG